jgi:hypothetical protein
MRVTLDPTKPGLRGLGSRHRPQGSPSWPLAPLVPGAGERPGGSQVAGRRRSERAPAICDRRLACRPELAHSNACLIRWSRWLGCRIRAGIEIRRIEIILSSNADQREKGIPPCISEQFLRMVDDWRRSQVDLPSRAEAIRRLVELATKIKKKPDSLSWPNK